MIYEHADSEAGEMKINFFRRCINYDKDRMLVFDGIGTYIDAGTTDYKLAARLNDVQHELSRHQRSVNY